MQLLEIYVPELNSHVKFKVLEYDYANTVMMEYVDLPQRQAVQKILELYVYNFKSDIIPAIKRLEPEEANRHLKALYGHVIMLNPGLDIDGWLSMAWNSKTFNDLFGVAEDIGPIELMGASGMTSKEGRRATPSSAPKGVIAKISREKFLNLETHLSERVIGQPQAIKQVVDALKRSQAGLNDTNRPLGVFIYAGSSGVGKTLLAKELHSYLFGTKHELIRIDCGEFMQKHENQKILGAPPGYIGHGEATSFLKAVQKNPYSVVLLDEAEKAHDDFWNTFLRVFDEGILTDGTGKEVNFRNTVIIMTTNLGNDKIVKELTARKTGFTAVNLSSNQVKTQLPSRNMVQNMTMEAIKAHFKPEFLNRVDKTIIFNHLLAEDYRKIAELEIQKTADKLSKQGYKLEYDENLIDKMVTEGVTTVEGARGLAGVRRDIIENHLADQLLANKFPRGHVFYLNEQDF